VVEEEEDGAREAEDERRTRERVGTDAAPHESPGDRVEQRRGPAARPAEKAVEHDAV
jgi:hypothetical protein